MDQREILDAIKAGKAIFTWTELESGPVKFRVTSDAVKINGIRIPVSAATTDAAAAIIGALPTTAKVEDLIFRAAKYRAPAFPGILLASCPSHACPHAKTDAGGKPLYCTVNERLWRRGVEHSAQVEAMLGSAGAQAGDLVATVGKSWVLSNVTPKGKAANYGWHSKHAPYLSATIPDRCWQPLSTAHAPSHFDYSQTLRLLHSKCKVNETERDTAEVLRDPALAKFLSHEGPIKNLLAARSSTPAPVIEDDEPTNPSIPTPVPAAWRVLRRGMKGPDVKAWQNQLERDGYSLAPYGADGDFGKLTEATTIRWQVDRDVEEPTGQGTVGPATIAAIGKVPIPEDPPQGSLEEDGPLWLAKNYTKAGRSSIDLIVIHSMEAPEKGDTAEAVAAWFAGKRGTAPRASAHVCVDSDSLIRGVPPEHVAWAAPGANGIGYQIEHAGYARQTRDQWLDAYSSAMLRRSAFHAGKVARLYGIPFEVVDVAGLKAKRRGFTTHKAVSLAFGRSSHVDPGPFWPWDFYLEHAKRR